MEGYLSSKASTANITGRRVWKRRYWCIVDGDLINYSGRRGMYRFMCFKSKRAKNEWIENLERMEGMFERFPDTFNLHGAFDVNQISQCMPCQKKARRFEVKVQAMKLLQLRAPTPDEAQQWVASIESYRLLARSRSGARYSQHLSERQDRFWKFKCVLNREMLKKAQGGKGALARAAVAAQGQGQGQHSRPPPINLQLVAPPSNNAVGSRLSPVFEQPDSPASLLSPGPSSFGSSPSSPSPSTSRAFAFPSAAWPEGRPLGISKDGRRFRGPSLRRVRQLLTKLQRPCDKQYRMQQYQRSMTLRNPSEGDDEGSKQAGAPAWLRKRSGEEDREKQAAVATLGMLQMLKRLRINNPQAEQAWKNSLPLWARQRWKNIRPLLPESPRSPLPLPISQPSSPPRGRAAAHTRSHSSVGPPLARPSKQAGGSGGARGQGVFNGSHSDNGREDSLAAKLEALRQWALGNGPPCFSSISTATAVSSRSHRHRRMLRPAHRRAQSSDCLPTRSPEAWGTQERGGGGGDDEEAAGVRVREMFAAFLRKQTKTGER